MLARLLAALLLVVAFPAAAKERRWAIPGFDRIRIEAPVEVRIVTGGPSGATASSDDPSLPDRLEITVDGGMLVVRLPGNATRPAGAPRGLVRLSTMRLRAATVFGSGTATVAGMAGDRIDLTVNGPGTLSATAIATPRLAATVIGEGRIDASGSATDTRLTVNGGGAIDARVLSVDRLAAQLVDGGGIRAAARYAASVIAAKDTSATIEGKARCTVRAAAGATVVCGGR